MFNKESCIVVFVACHFSMRENFHSSALFFSDTSHVHNPDVMCLEGFLSLHRL